MYKGTFEGDAEEVEFVKRFNANKGDYSEYLKHFTDDYSNYWMVRVTTKQISSLSNKRVFTRADCYLIEAEDDITYLVRENEFYLSENILPANNIKHRKVPKSGISIKMVSSQSYQILKVGPDSFKNLFGSYELGAGASLFCQKEEELMKNKDLFAGWKTAPEKMTSFFDDFTNGDTMFYLNQKTCRIIKTFSSGKIAERINNDETLQQKVFNGIYLYEEPYPAYFFYHGDVIEDLKTLPFYVTTGSGRSHGDYTIVLKPSR